MTTSNQIIHDKTYKTYPAYGKRIDALRRKGLIPVPRVMVSTDWGLGARYPRIVIAADAQIDKLIFNYLAGLHVQINHHADEAALVRSLVNEILKINPKTLTLFNVDVADQIDHLNLAFSVIHPTWEVLQNDLQ